MTGITTNLLISAVGCTLFILSNKSFKHKITSESRDGKCSFCRDKSYSYRGRGDYDCDTCEIILVTRNGNRILTNGKSFEYNFFPF